MRRRDFGRYVGMLSAGAVASVSGCLSTFAEQGSDDPGSQPDDASPSAGEVLPDGYPDHARFLYHPDRVETNSYGEWYGYILNFPSEMPKGHRWRKPYDEFGIEYNLRHYAIDGSMDMMMQDYGSVDVTKYDTESDLWYESPEDRIEDDKIKPAIRVERPASTGGRLEDQEIVEASDGFRIYERGGAASPSQNILVSSPQEYLRTDIIPEIVKTATGDVEPYTTDDLRLLWENVDLGGYNEFGLNPKYMETYRSDTEITAFGISQEVTSDGDVEITQVELFPNEDLTVTEVQSGRLSWSEYDVEETVVDGRAVVHTSTVDEVITSY